VRDTFRKLATATADLVGSPVAFLLALVTILVWGACGPMFHFSDTWQLVINTGTTIVTFLVVFLIQGAQNRESRATQLKLDELIRAVASARNGLVALEECTEEELERYQREFARIRRARGVPPEEIP
jgi:low affinity Fe/Cu permease